MASPAVRGDDYLHITCQPYHLLDDSLAKRRRPLALPRPGQEQVSDAIEPREFDQSFCDIAALQHARFDMEITREIQVALYRFSLRGISRIIIPGDGHGEAVRMQVVGHAFSAADQHGCRRIARHMDQNPVTGPWNRTVVSFVAVERCGLKARRLIIHLPDFYLVRGLPQSQLA